jgi:hypothetical protein
MIQKHGFVIDKITNSIEQRKSGKSFDTDILAVTSEEVKTVLKKNGWVFNWKMEHKQQGHELYKLVVKGKESIEGLVSLEIMDSYIEMHLIETAPHNKGDNREFLGVAGNLVAFVCKMSFDLGFEGCVAFMAKTKLIGHYSETLGAKVIYGHERMGIFTEAAKKLVDSYYKK